jgi:hypothetical protein
MPRWVKVSLVITLLVLVVFVVALASGGSHGPGRHLGGLPLTAQHDLVQQE